MNSKAEARLETQDNNELDWTASGMQFQVGQKFHHL